MLKLKRDKLMKNYNTKSKKKKKNSMPIIFSQQILSGKSLLVITSKPKKEFKLWIQIITNNNLQLMICCESIVKIL